MKRRTLQVRSPGWKRYTGTISILSGETTLYLTSVPAPRFHAFSKEMRRALCDA
jgi:hypothetical protein